MYLQQRIAGVPGSISFAADGKDAVLLGFSRQLVGQRSFGAGRFRYCGSILGHPDVRLFRRQRSLLERAARVAAVLTREFGLVGLNGIDFIAHQGVPYPIEVNPRYSASMELVERAHRVSMFGIHAQACEGGLPVLPPSDRQVHGKAIVFARQDSEVGDTRGWLRRSWVADVPHPSEHIAAGRPICTVFARAPYPRQCRQLLVRRARKVYRALTPASRRAA
jgi:predicted ATP-grasp superfamily ATP-dependent carboligase